MIYRPNRAGRRAVAGQKCSVCPNKMHWTDVWAIVDSEATFYAHAECLLLALDEKTASAQAEEGTPGTEAEAEQNSTPQTSVLGLSDPTAPISDHPMPTEPMPQEWSDLLQQEGY